MIPQNKIVRQLVWHLLYVDTAVEGNELYCYNTEGDRNSVVCQASCKIYVTWLEQCAHIKIATLWGINARDSSLWKGIVSHSFHKLSVALSSISPSRYGYVDVGTLF